MYKCLDEKSQFIHVPNDHRNDIGSPPGSFGGKCWGPIKIVILLLLTPFLLLYKLMKVMYEICSYFYLALLNQEKLLENCYDLLYQHQTRKMQRAPLTMEKESAGIDQNLQKVEKRVFHRIQPSLEYLAIESLLVKLATRGASQEQIFSEAQKLKENDNVNLRKKHLLRNKNLKCKTLFMKQSNCKIERSSFRIESY